MNDSKFHSIIEEIKNVRIAYFDLISGYQEVNYGNTINIMLGIKDYYEEYHLLCRNALAEIEEEIEKINSEETAEE
mgnify:CR=1 FL=1